ncbi:pyruvate dehydrogenase complex dihydrolipoamide acetyltransferase [Cytophaga aurantiaca]|uniref:pyruvate dehydrogenase complex dihydrolipoamide acetyltransferase n=1 Tax=Cytophaga aurantiaca TaxID=29530 RepID=UPI00037D72D5|nr:pyruvate dehydrogenase complex dihydrolipoamide acetyltransferase [Cytophaga aurantiaca]
MAELIKMPKMSDTMTEGVIAAWHKKVGDKVKSGDLLAEVETDKATMEMESYEDGTLLYIAAEAKSAVPIDGVIAVIGKDGENIDALLSQIKNGGAPAAAPKAEAKAEAPAAVAEQAASSAPAVDLSSIKAEAILMPKMSDTMVEGTIVAWHKKVGDAVKSGELLAEVATDKATMEMESYEDGTLLHIAVNEGDAVKIDGLIAIIGAKGTDVTPIINAYKNGKPSAAPAAASAPAKTESASAPAAASAPASNGSASSDERSKISPLARKIASDKGIDIRQVKGTGDHGRVVKRDVENFKAAPAEAAPAKGASAPAAASLPNVVGQESFDEVPVSQMRKVIVKRLSESLFTAPHFYLTMEINMDKAIEARGSINEVATAKVSFNDMVIRASAAALRKHPMVNASWQGDKIRVNHHIHIGVAIAIEDGLVVPVVRFADSKSLSHISQEVKELGAKAKSKKIQPADMSGNTFTISNLGMFGIDEFTSIINSPDACILSVGGIKQTPIVKNGQIVVGNIMKVTLACDHRVVDGAVGSAFLQTLKSYLEDPVRILA